MDVSKNKDIENTETKENNYIILDIQKDLKKCKESKLQTESQYIQCKKELSLKTAEVEILKIEPKDIKEILN